MFVENSIRNDFTQPQLCAFAMFTTLFGSTVATNESLHDDAGFRYSDWLHKFGEYGRTGFGRCNLASRRN